MTKYKVAESRDSKRYYKRYRSHSLVVDDQLPLTCVSSSLSTPPDTELMEEEKEDQLLDEGMGLCWLQWTGGEAVTAVLSDCCANFVKKTTFCVQAGHAEPMES